jgi:hypothetical protein
MKSIFKKIPPNGRDFFVDRETALWRIHSGKTYLPRARIFKWMAET